MLKDLLQKIRRSERRTDGDEAAKKLITHGNTLEDAGRLEEACRVYREAVQAAPSLPAAHLNLGLGLAATGDAGGAEEAYERVLALDPSHAFGCYNYASLCYRREDLSRAEDLVRRALRSKPDLYQAHLLLSNIADDKGDVAAAISSAQEALRHCAEYAGAHHNLALLLQRAGRLEEALGAVERATALDNLDPARHALLASLLASNGLMEEALEALQHARRLGTFDPELSAAKELFYLNFDDRVDAAQGFAQHRDHGQRLESAAPVVYQHLRPVLPPPDDGRLRIGFVSGDLRTHPVALFLIPLLEGHERSRLHITCYSCGENEDVITRRLMGLADRWENVRQLSDTSLARKIHSDRIDILVDLSGYSGAIRAPTFAQKPAPVQVAWLGYLNTTGLSRMDYRVTDMRADPPDIAGPMHQEKLAFLPNSQWCYRPFLKVLPSPDSPAKANGFVTFGSFNQAAKITRAQCRRWADILQRVPRSRLLIADVNSGRKRAVISEVMREAGVSDDRLEFVPRMDLEAYYRSFAHADIALDTYPYTGGTTTFDALVHGVPVLTARGSTSFARSASSILAGLDLDEWIAADIDGYVDLAVRRAREPERLAALRKQLPKRVETSAFMDEPGFNRDIEALFRRMWSERGKPQ